MRPCHVIHQVAASLIVHMSFIWRMWFIWFISQHLVHLAASGLSGW
jgi:hypothetical protein